MSILLLIAEDKDFIGVQVAILQILNEKNRVKSQMIHYEAILLLNNGYLVDTLIELTKDLKFSVISE